MSEKQKPLDPADTPWFTTKIPAAATTLSQRRKVEITKAPVAMRGTKDIRVDGKVWGQAEYFGAGGNGAYYQIRQLGGSWIEAPAEPGRSYAKPLQVWSDQVAYRRARDGGHKGPLPKFADRLLAAAQLAVDTGALVSPTVISKREAELQKRLDAIRKKAAADTRNKYRERAKLRGWAGLSSDQLEIIVGLMVWANETD